MSPDPGHPSSAKACSPNDSGLSEWFLGKQLVYHTLIYVPKLYSLCLKPWHIPASNSVFTMLESYHLKLCDKSRISRVIMFRTHDHKIRIPFSSLKDLYDSPNTCHRKYNLKLTRSHTSAFSCFLSRQIKTNNCFCSLVLTNFLPITSNTQHNTTQINTFRVLHYHNTMICEAIALHE